MYSKFHSNHFTFLKFENPSSGSKVRQQFRQQLCYQVAAVTAALAEAWLLGSSSMHWKFNSDHFTFLKFENLSSGSKVRQQFWQQLCFQVAAVTAALVLVWSPGSNSMYSKFNSDHFIFLSQKICPVVQKLGRSFCRSFTIRQQLSQQLWQLLGYQVAAQCTGNLFPIILLF